MCPAGLEDPGKGSHCVSFLFITCLVGWLVATSFCGPNGALAWGRVETKLVSETRTVTSVAMASAKDREDGDSDTAVERLTSVWIHPGLYGKKATRRRQGWLLGFIM